MELWFIAYSGKNSRNTLVLCLGEDETKYYCLEADDIPEECIEKIKCNWHALSTLDAKQKVMWLKSFCPAAMQWYKGIYKANCTIISKFEVADASH